MMRMVLIDGDSNSILGDTAEFAVERLGWATQSDLPPDSLAVIAARLFDEDRGLHGWTYRFSHFCPHDTKNGYAVFSMLQSFRMRTDPGVDPFWDLLTASQYMGYVDRLPPVANLASCE